MITPFQKYHFHNLKKLKEVEIISQLLFLDSIISVVGKSTLGIMEPILL